MKNKAVSVYHHGRLVGRLAQTKSGVTAFEYASAWLEDGFSISPFELPLKKQVFIASKEPFDGLFGVFNDSLPDGWGRLIIDRLLRKQSINPSAVSPLERLCIVGKSGMGALEYEPVTPLFDKFDVGRSDLDELATAVEKVLQNEETAHLEHLIQISGSSGGARPKVLIKIDGEDWLIKFPSRHDDKNIGLQEFNCSVLARSAGITMSETKLFNGKYFGTKRFDRLPSGKKVHMLSLAGLLNDNYRLPSLDYIQVMGATLALTHNFEEVAEMYRRMCFNVFIGNLDDHSRNFSFIYDGHKWQVSSAYDLVESQGLSGEHATMVGGLGKNITEENLMSIAVEVGLANNRAKDILEQVRGVCHDLDFDECVQKN